MENFEKEDFLQDLEMEENQENVQEIPADQPVAEQQPYHGMGAGRKESPFANSPYVMYHEQPKAAPQQGQTAYIPPVPPQEVPRKPKKQAKSGGKVWKTVLCTVLAIAILAGSCGATAYIVNNKWETKTDMMIDSFEDRMNQLQDQLDEIVDQRDVIVGYPTASNGGLTPGAIYQQNVESVVLISAEVTSAPNMFGQSSVGVSTGSGFVLSEDGYVVTNHHVVEGASGVTVTLHDGTEYAAKIVGSDATNDVAVLKITEDVQLQAAEIGSSTVLSVGDQVVAIGNPLGELTSTLTVGYVSAKERDVTTDGRTINMIQTDAAINSGNSGGPLFNSLGQVVGITTAKYSGSSSSGATIEGIGFAIPIDDAMPLVDDFINYGYINSAFLGVMVSEMDSSTANYYGLPVGAYVQEVTAGYCAEKAGLEVKDIIVALGEYEVENLGDLTKALRKFKAGDTTTITVYRGGREITLPITLDEKPRDTAAETPAPSGNGNLPQDGNYEDWYNYFFGNKG